MGEFNSTIWADSQSAPALIGIEAEQKFRRMYLFASATDHVLVEAGMPIDPNYLNYLQHTLNIELPKFVQIEQPLGQALTSITGAILGSEPNIVKLQELIDAGNSIQFFGITELERELVEKLDGNPTHSKDFVAYQRIGTKVGFRNFCDEYNLPMAFGQTFTEGSTLDDLLNYLDDFMTPESPEFLLKSSEGTGGADLGSNTTITFAELVGLSHEEAIAILQDKMTEITPSDFPLVAEQKLSGLPESSVHIFIDKAGNVRLKPVIYGQLAEHGSYIGGYYSNVAQPTALQQAILAEANTQIVPALIVEGATGMHCLDFLYDDETEEHFYIEDNTRPGALDFIAALVEKTIVANPNLGDEYAWYHRNTPLSELGLGNSTSFTEVQAILGSGLDPNSEFAQENGYFFVVSNPDVLQYGYELHLTAVSLDGNIANAETAYAHAKSIFNASI